MLERSRRYVPALFDNEEWSKMVDQEVYDIRRLPADAGLRIRRPVKTHPMINLLWQDREPRKQQIKASLPCCSAPIPSRPSPIWATTRPSCARHAGIARLAVTPL